MKKNITTLFLASIFSIAQPYSQATISSFSPNSGNIGIPITISGTNFSTSGNEVYFGTIKADIANESSTSITTYVPAGYANEKIRVKKIEDSLMAYSPLPFNQTHCSNNNVDFALASFPYTQGTAGERSTVLADFNADGFLDLAVCSRNENKIYIYENTTTGGIISFGSAVELIATSPVDICTGDFNGDGRLDIATCSFDTDEIGVFLNANFSFIAFFSELNYPTGIYPYGIWADDIDGDGMTDILTANHTGSNLSIFRNLGYYTGTADFAVTTYSTGLSGIIHELRTGDLDMDGDVDIVVAQRTAGVRVIINNSTSGTISLSDFGNVISSGAESVAIDDYDGDGLLDIAAVGQSSTNMNVVRNTMSGSLSFSAPLTQPAVLSYGMSSGDVTGDGLIDIIVPNNVDNQVMVFKNTSSPGNISFTSSSMPGGGTLISSFCSSVGDLNNDGGADVVNSPLGGSQVIIYEKKNVISSYYFVETISLCKGESYTFPDGTTENNIQTPITHLSTYTTSVGSCDSIYETSINLDAANLNITLTGSTLSAEATGAIYQWVNCSTGYSFISGATSQIFNPSNTGNYACIITENGCLDTTDCLNVSVIGLKEVLEKNILLYPNPSNGYTHIDLGNSYHQVDIMVFDISGKLLALYSNENIKQFNLNMNFEPGIYFIAIETEAGKALKKLILE